VDSDDERAGLPVWSGLLACLRGGCRQRYESLHTIMVSLTLIDGEGEQAPSDHCWSIPRRHGWAVPSSRDPRACGRASVPGFRHESLYRASAKLGDRACRRLVSSDTRKHAGQHRDSGIQSSWSRSLRRADEGRRTAPQSNVSSRCGVLFRARLLARPVQASSPVPTPPRPHHRLFAPDQ
jgi:hypothetical protein